MLASGHEVPLRATEEHVRCSAPGRPGNSTDVGAVVARLLSVPAVPRVYPVTLAFLELGQRRGQLLAPYAAEAARHPDQPQPILSHLPIG